MEFKIKKVIPLVILILSVFFIYTFLQRNTEELQKVTSLGVLDFVFISAVVLITIVINGLKNKTLLKSFEVNLKLRDWLGLSVVNTFWNYLPFQGGLIVKGAYLKKKYDFPYTSYLATAIASYLITFLVFGLIGCLGLWLIYINLSLFSSPILLIYGLLALLSLGGILYFRISRLQKFPWSFLRQLHQGIVIILSKPKTFLTLILLDTVAVLVYALRLTVASWVLGYSIPFIFYFLVAPVALLAIFTSITPGGLVIREALIGIFAGFIGVSVTESVVAGVLDRGVSMIWIFALGIIFNYYLSKHFLKKQSYQTNNF